MRLPRLLVGPLSLIALAATGHSAGMDPALVGPSAVFDGSGPIGPAPSSNARLGALRGLAGFSDGEIPAVGRPRLVAEPLDPGLLEPGKGVAPKAKAEWRRLIQEGGGKARIVPLGEIDPTKEVLVYVPGIGLNFQDGHGLAMLGGRFQLVFAIFNQNHPLDRNGRDLADALAKFAEYRRALALARGLAPSRELRVLGHSYGGLAVQLMVAELVKAGLIQEAGAGLFSRVRLFIVDAGWRGVDLPWAFTLPGIKHVMREALPRLPLPKRAWRSSLSVANRTSSMDAIKELRFPDSITVRVVNVPARQRVVEPVAGWHSFELKPGELERIWDFYRHGGNDFRRLERWSHLGLTRRQELLQLFKTLSRDSDYPALAAELAQEAARSDTLEDFRARYDAAIARAVDTFEGQHTRFMWEDPRFLDWLRAALE